MKPSDVAEVFLRSVPPMIDTFGHAEGEFAASLYVRACQKLGDQWQPLLPKQVGESFKADVDEKVEPWVSLNSNPFFRLDFHELVKKGFATIAEADKAFAFTHEGLEVLGAKLQKWRKRLGLPS